MAPHAGSRRRSVPDDHNFTTTNDTLNHFLGPRPKRPRLAANDSGSPTFTVRNTDKSNDPVDEHSTPHFHVPGSTISSAEISAPIIPANLNVARPANRPHMTENRDDDDEDDLQAVSNDRSTLPVSSSSTQKGRPQLPEPPMNPSGEIDNQHLTRRASIVSASTSSDSSARPLSPPTRYAGAKLTLATGTSSSVQVSTAMALVSDSARQSAEAARPPNPRKRYEKGRVQVFTRLHMTLKWLFSQHPSFSSFPNTIWSYLKLFVSDETVHSIIPRFADMNQTKCGHEPATVAH